MEIRPNLFFNRFFGKKEVGDGEKSPSEKEWTVLLYLDGNNNIEGDILTSFLTCEEVSEHQKLNMVAQLGRAPQSIAHTDYKDNIDGDWDGVRRYEMKKGMPFPYPREVWTSLGKHDGKIDSRVVADLGKADMSDKKHLIDFLKWGMEKYPAKHYMVVLASHGAGFLGSLTDYKSKKHMSVADMADAFRQVEKDTGKKPDLLVMDSCLMAQAEAAHELKDSAKYYVASEDINWDCLPLQKTIEQVQKQWGAGKEVSPEEMVGYLVNESGKYHSILSISALNMEKMKDFTRGMKKLADALLATGTDPELIRKIIKKTRDFGGGNERVKPYSDYRDIKDFAINLILEEKIEDKKLKKAAESLIKTLDNNFIIDERHASKHNLEDRQRIWGLSVYLPITGFDYSDLSYIFPTDTNKDEYEGIYRSLEFAKKTGWDRVIDKFAVPGSAVPGSKAIRGNQVIDALIKLSQS